MPNPAYFPGPDPVGKRDDGLRRVGTATRWAAAVATAAAIVLGVDYAHALPGTTGEASGAVQHTSDGDVQQQPQEQPQQPQSVPGYDSQPAQTVTGAS